MRIEIGKIFEGKEVTIIGGGSSLIGFDFNRVRRPVIAVNLSVYNYPKCDIVLWLDVDRIQKEVIDNQRGKIITDRGAEMQGVYKINYETQSEDSLDWKMQKCNLSGFAALAVAFHLGAKKVYLLGFDGGFDKISNHYYHNSNTESKMYEANNIYFEYFKDYPIINVGLNSKIKYFKKVDINSNFYK